MQTEITHANLNMMNGALHNIQDSFHEVQDTVNDIQSSMNGFRDRVQSLEQTLITILAYIAPLINPVNRGFGQLPQIQSGE